MQERKSILFRVFLLAAILGLQVNNSYLFACDVCGCSIGGTNLGILPQFHKNFLGFHYFNRDFSSQHAKLGTDSKSTSQEIFKTLELRGRLHLNKRIQLFILLPFNLNKQIEDKQTSSFSGFGDITTFANFSIFNNNDTLCSRWKYNLQLGGGAKLPTGSYTKLDINKILNPNIQIGTGAFDFLLDAIYTIRYKNYGINTTAFYRFNTTNSNKFKFGNRFTLISSFFYWAQLKSVSLLPSIGINYDHTAKDIHNSFIVEQSGGSSIFSNCGIDFYYQNISIGFNFQLPIYQDNPNFFGNLRFNTTLLYNF